MLRQLPYKLKTTKQHQNQRYLISPVFIWAPCVAFSLEKNDSLCVNRPHASVHNYRAVAEQSPFYSFYERGRLFSVRLNFNSSPSFVILVSTRRPSEIDLISSTGPSTYPLRASDDIGSAGQLLEVPGPAPLHIVYLSFVIAVRSPPHPTRPRVGPVQIAVIGENFKH